jgi:hypothetical protein
MPPSKDDLALLEERGLITMNEGEPVLTEAAANSGLGSTQ